MMIKLLFMSFGHFQIVKTIYSLSFKFYKVIIYIINILVKQLSNLHLIIYHIDNKYFIIKTQ
jgi:hypothetical protein